MPSWLSPRAALLASTLLAVVAAASIALPGAAAVVACDNVPGNAWGLTPYTSGPDVIQGTGRAETLCGGDGADRIVGGGGDDALHGDAGDDSINANRGHDSVSGGPGLDELGYHGARQGVQVSLNGIADDGVGPNPSGDVADDVENVFGSAHADRLAGDGDANRLYGEGGDDQLDGGAGNDTLVGRGGADVFSGGTGADLVKYEPEETLPIVASIGDGAEDGAVDGGRSEGDDVQGDVEKLSGGAGDDVLTGDDGPNALDGLGGDDALDGGDGADLLHAGPGADTFIGGLGAADAVDYGGTENRTVTVTVGSGADDGVEVAGSSEGDDVRGDVEKVVGGAGDDHLTGSAGDETLLGRAGDDEVLGGGGEDYLKGGPGADDLVGGGEDDHLNGEAGDDHLDGGTGDDALGGSSGGDEITGGTGDDRVTGGLGADTLHVEGDGAALDAVHCSTGIDDTFADAADAIDHPSCENAAPVAGDDTESVSADAAGAAVDVRADDTDQEGRALTVSEVNTGATTGAASMSGGGVDYDPDGQFDALADGGSGADAFTYRSHDGRGESNLATVSVTITGVNDAPTLATNSGSALAYTENGPSTAVMPCADDRRRRHRRQGGRRGRRDHRQLRRRPGRALAARPDGDGPLGRRRRRPDPRQVQGHAVR